MKQLLFLLIVVAFPVLLLSQNTPGVTFGGQYNDVGYALCPTGDNGFLLAGKTRVTATGDEELFIVKVNTHGNEVWQHTFGWNRHDNLQSVKAVADGYVMAGSVWEFGLGVLDICLVKTDLYGNEMWHKLYGTNSRDIGFDVVPTHDGGYLLLGHSRGYDNAGDALLIKTNQNGDELWRKSFGDEFDDYAQNLIENYDGTITMIGSKGAFYDDIHANFKNSDADIYFIQTDGEGETILEKTIGGTGHDLGRSVVESEQGGWYLFGSTQSEGNGSFDMLLAKTNESGNVEWQKTYGGSEFDQGASMDKNFQNELFLLGTTKSFGAENSTDIYLVKTDEEGNEIWSVTLGGDNSETAYKVIATADSGCALIGETRSFGEGMSDLLFARVDKDGMIDYFLNSNDTQFAEKTVVYPMPLQSHGRVKFEQGDNTKVYTMEIISLSGILAQSFRIQPPAYGFDVGTLAPGMYFYRISSEDNSSRVIKGKLLIY